MRYLTLFAALLAIAACKNVAGTESRVAAAAAGTDTVTYTSIQWIDSLKELGPVKFGQVVQIDFKFKNTGTYPLYIVAAVPGCGCTVTDFPKGAIAPGDEGTITAAFDSNKGHEGVFRKNINVTTNTKGSTFQVLYFSGSIVKEGGPDSSSRKTGKGKEFLKVKAIKMA